MTLNDCIIDAPVSGICKIDLVIAKKYFTKKCSVSKWGDTFTLIRWTHKRHRVLKARISPNDAFSIINDLDLIEGRGFFKSGSSFMLRAVNETLINS